MIKDITVSIQKDIRSLHRRKIRDEKKKFFVEGIRIVEEAIQEDVNIHYVVISDSFGRHHPIVQSLVDKGIDIYISKDKMMRELSDTDTPQGIMAVMDYVESLPNLDEDMIVILDSIQDPGNMGTILRTADAVFVNRVIVSKGSVDVYNPKVLRSTMGSIFRVPIERTDNLVNSIIQLRHEGYKVIATHLRGEKNHYDVELKNKIAIVVGNEANGVRDEVVSVCDELIKIPMRGRTESLNASVSAGVVMYEALRQKL